MCLRPISPQNSIGHSKRMAKKGGAAKKPSNEIDPAKLPDFSAEEIEEVKEAFAIFDKTGKGIIDLQDMLTYLQGLRVHEKYFTIYSMIQRLAREFPKGISVKEFLEHVQWMFGDIETGGGLTRLFELLNTTGTPYLNLQRFEQLAKEIGENVTHDDLVDLIESYYECPLDKVDVDSFYRMMSKRTF